MKDIQFHTYLRGIILIGYALLILKLFLTFDMVNFVAEKMHGYLYFSLFVFIILGIIQILRGTAAKPQANQCGCDAHELPKGRLKTVVIYSMFIVPVLLGFVMPDNLLDSSIASNRGVNIGNSMFSTPPTSTNKEMVTNEKQDENKEESVTDVAEGVQPKLESYENFPLEDDYEKLTEIVKSSEKVIVRDEQFIPTLSVVDENLDLFIGKEVQLTGFIYKDESFAEDQAVISRFTVTCCVADASVYGYLTNDEKLASLDPDTWVNVSGIIDKVDFNGNMMPVITNPTFEVIEPPAKPYVEEFYIKIE